MVMILTFCEFFLKSRIIHTFFFGKLSKLFLICSIYILPTNNKHNFGNSSEELCEKKQR